MNSDTRSFQDIERRQMNRVKRLFSEDAKKWHLKTLFKAASSISLDFQFLTLTCRRNDLLISVVQTLGKQIVTGLLKNGVKTKQFSANNKHLRAQVFKNRKGEEWMDYRREQGANA